MKSAFLLLFIGSIPVAHASGYEHAISPNHRFEAYTTAHYPDGTGMRLFLRAAGSSEPGVILRENDRWIRANWSPDSRFLAVVDGSDGHVTDVFVYRVLRSRGNKTKVITISFQSLGNVASFAQAPHLVSELCYHTPNPSTYDVQWDVAGWDRSRELILLTKRSPGAKLKRIRALLPSPRGKGVTNE